MVVIRFKARRVTEPGVGVGVSVGARVEGARVGVGGRGAEIEDGDVEGARRVWLAYRSETVMVRRAQSMVGLADLSHDMPRMAS